MPTITLPGYGTFDRLSSGTGGTDSLTYASPASLTLTVSEDHIVDFDGNGFGTMVGSVSDPVATLGGIPGRTFEFEDLFDRYRENEEVRFELDWSLQRITHANGVTDVLEIVVDDALKEQVDREIIRFWFPLAGPALPEPTFSEIYFDDPLAFVIEPAGNGPLFDGEGFSFLDAAAGLYPSPLDALGVDLTAGPEGGLLAGTDRADTLDGGTGDDQIPGEGGDDRISGMAGNDLLAGGEGFDTIGGGDGDDTIGGGPGDDLIYAGEGNDIVGAGLGNDFISGGGDGDDADTLSAGAGDDEIEGGGGDDLIAGSFGNDYINAGAGNDTVGGGQGNDVVDAFQGNDAVYAGAGMDLVNGMSGNDLLAGGFGRDTLDGGLGEDTLRGGPGDDVLYGLGEGATTAVGESFGDGAVDVFQFNAAQPGGSDTIFGFELELDIIEIANLGNASKITVTSQAGERLSFEFLKTSVEINGLTTEDFDALNFDLG